MSKENLERELQEEKIKYENDISNFRYEKEQEEFESSV